MSEQCEQTSERTSKWPSTSVWILGCSSPQWNVNQEIKAYRVIKVISHDILRKCMIMSDGVSLVKGYEENV